MDNNPTNRQDYVRKVLAAYCQTPGIAGRVHPQDRLFAVQLHHRGIPLTVVENAIILAAVRRLYRDPAAPPLSPVRCLIYFQPLIEEVLATTVSQRYYEYLRAKVDNFEQFKQRYLQSRSS